MKKSWWKILGVILVLYVIIVGLLVPLGVGIEEFSPTRASSGEVTEVSITGYNTEYEAAPVKVWLKVDDYVIDANPVKILDDRKLVAHFDIPEHLPVEDEFAIASLIVSSKNGTAVLPRAISVRQIQVDQKAAMESWHKDIEVNSETNINYPYRNILQESIRNQYFHVPLWFGMILLMTGGLWNSVRVLRTKSISADRWTLSLNTIAVLFGFLGIVTGAIWANYAWGKPWSGDIKQNMAAICLLIYGAYFMFRMSIEDRDKRMRVSNAYNIFAYAAMIPLLFVIPRMTDSLHPGSGGNPGFGRDDLDNTMRMVFYPAVIGWTILGLWIASLKYRYINIKEHILEKYKYKK